VLIPKNETDVHADLQAASSRATRSPEQIIRETLSPLLHRQGYGALCRDEDPKPRRLDLSSWGGVLFFLYVLAVPTWNVSRLFDLPLLAVGVIYLVSFVAVLAAVAKLEAVAVVAVLGLGTLTVIARIIFDGWSSAAATVGGFAAVALTVLYIPRVFESLRRLDLVGVIRSVPLVFPVTLLLLFVPLFTSELWRTATILSTGAFVGAAALLIVPPGFVLLQQIIGRVNHSHATEALKLEAEQSVAEAVGAEISRLATKARADEVLYHAQAEIEQSFQSPGPTDRTPILTATLRGVLRRQAVSRLVSAVVGVGLVLFVYVYALCAVSIPRPLAAEWSQQEVSLLDIGIVALPVGPYVAVSSLLALFAAAAFIALIITEAHFSEVMTDAVLRAPARALLLQAVPYQSAAEADGQPEASVEEHSVTTGSRPPDSGVVADSPSPF